MSDLPVLSPVKGHMEVDAAGVPPPPPAPPADTVGWREDEVPLPPPTPTSDQEEKGGPGPVFTLDSDESAPSSPSPGAGQPLPGSVEELEAQEPTASPSDTSVQTLAPEARTAVSGSSPGGLASVLEAVAEAATAAARTAPPEPARSSAQTPQDSYASEEMRLRTPFQRKAFRQLKNWDEEVEGKFTARQAVNLARQLSEKKALADEGRRSLAQLLSCGGITLTWIVLAALIVLVPLTVGAVLARDVRAESTGIIVTNSLGGSSNAGATQFVTHKGLAELGGLSEAELRQIKDCTFVHRGAFHRLSVASLVRWPSGIIRLASADRSSLKIQGDGNTTEMTFNRPFIGDQKVDLQDPSNADETAACSFVAMKDAQSKASPSLS
eukprot:CAMPEP_0197621148 /NCGR_PEP_ID=MMETSP1338-20131121/1776_1 /TAXON_ID=43686 ORGANISM="Pelagodinium beii, Strain RCC1491" /NCGR_SAMPLE_ID=MMETSP1338 /ASSEMBLY_ACC=CAM_ASM_000754 /LENGTH=381 /DNA_ID=CAMNT_0043190505 /DNA_START=44 /DNA_END=1189 /DNA_ORIENTATION=+